jgi:hypothetical protein
LKKQVAVSFEDSHIRVVFAYQDKGKTTIQRTVLLREEEFDAFLEANKLPNLSVVYPFRNFYSDVVSVPPVKKSYMKAIEIDKDNYNKEMTPYLKSLSIDFFKKSMLNSLDFINS